VIAAALNRKNGMRSLDENRGGGSTVGAITALVVELEPRMRLEEMSLINETITRQTT
jgi:hypothetical protein